MKPNMKLKLTTALFWAVLLGAIVITHRVVADDGIGRGRERERDEYCQPVPLPEANGWFVTIILGVGLVGFAAWKNYRRNMK